MGYPVRNTAMAARRILQKHSAKTMPAPKKPPAGMKRPPMPKARPKGSLY